MQNLIHHLGSELHGIGVVPVHHDIATGLNLPEHSADHVPLSLHVLMADHRTRRLCKLCGPVRGIVVIYVNHRLRQRNPCVGHHLGDCLFLIVTGNQHCDLVHLGILLWIYFS